ncbi:hypothetical protein PUN28_013881 [Cardiocondyla obscurior]|uniref:LisH domain-containing protein n=1 Tax=Cardiocondyla obscurior TaxID=286306 RepID=A0AAW2F7U5_9HYME
MEALLPSEIARLVLGYLEDQKCTEAAKLFLETSPHLQECRAVISCGRRFSTKVNGLTLMDVIEKLSAISTIIQERLSKVTDCEQLKHCGDLIEQLKFLVEEPRGQRFVVNINVPSQSNAQTSNGSPVAASNTRKRHYSNSERVKRSFKLQLNSMLQSDIMSPPSCHTVDTTPLESLPGNIDILKQAEFATHTTEKKDGNITQEPHRQCDLDRNNSINNITPQNKSNSDRSIHMSSDDISSLRSCEIDIDDKGKEESSVTSVIPKRYTTATSTEELLSFSSTEVQTTPYEIPESESESNDEPIENLSILTKEILNRTELQECIAENINKAIIPSDQSLRDENLNDSLIGEGNTSIMTELNNAIKSIVEATESDPVFEKFLDEIIGPQTETDTSPEEDGEGKPSPKSANEAQEKKIEASVSNVSSPEPVVTDSKVSMEDGTADVPLKHRLRSSSRQQCTRVEDELDKVRDQEKDQSALEDQNAAAVLSIIKANIINNVSDNDKKTLNTINNVSHNEKKILNTKESMPSNDDNEEEIQAMVSMINKNDDCKSLTVTNVQEINDVILPVNNNVQPKVKKSTVKRPKPVKPKHDQTSDSQISNSNQNCVQSNISQPVTEHEIMTMPTLIVCSKNEVNNFLINRSSTSTSRFIPIAPKDSNRIQETLYLRTVNVAQKVPVVKTLPAVVEKSNNSANQVELIQSTRKNDNVNKQLQIINKIDTAVPISIDQQILNHPIELPQTSKIAGSESITLYSNETSAKTSLDSSNMAMINLEENISLSDSGFSPYLKFSCSKTNQSHNLADIDLGPILESAKNTANNNKSTQSPKNVDAITKRTPKSLLKSRSKNHRLSLSTPRKRSSHIRALDFSTPTRTKSSTKKINVNESAQFSSTKKRLKSVCRTSLFRSPSFSNSSVQKQKTTIKVNQSYRIPIATRSPAPKLMGGWDNYNGVGVIIGEVSPHGSTSASCSSSEEKVIQNKPSESLVGSWDADLRKTIDLNKKNEKDESEAKKAVKRKKNSRDENNVICKKVKYNSQSSKSNDESTSCSKSKVNKKFKHNTDDTNRPEDNLQENITEPQNNEKENIIKATVNTANSIASKFNEHLKTNTCETSTNTNANPVNSDTVVTEKKSIKKYAQLKTLSTNLRKSDEKERNMEVAQINLQMSEVSKILSTDSTQNILRMPDMINLETPRKFDNISGPPPTPRVLSPSSNLITPFIKISEDSSKIRSFITTPEFPITPGVAITPKEETTRDIIKRGDYDSPYYKPTSEQVQDSNLKASRSKDGSMQESPILSSSHITSKLEITEFEVIKENLPREEAIKEFKIASTSKDSGSAGELSTSIVIDQHVNLIEINEFQSEQRETIIDADCVNEAHNNDSMESSSSSSDTSSSSSSSSSTSSSTTTNSSTNMCSPNEKCDKASSKMSTDISSDFAEKIINAPKNTCDVSAATSSDPFKKSDDAIETESSPKKVFAIIKTDDQLKNTTKETPAKDETLLNEADISETPSSSKSGVEMINLTTKISAIITEEKLSRSNKLLKNSKTQNNKSRGQPKVIDVQCIQPESSMYVKCLKPIKEECESENEQSAPVHDKFMHRQILEEKRQRIIAKIKDNPKLNLPSGTKRKHILTCRAASTLKKFGRGNRNIRPPARYSENINNKETKRPADQQETLKKNKRKKCESQKQDLVDKCSDNKGKTNLIPIPKSTDPGLTNHKNNGNKPPDDHTIKQLYENNICESNIVENCKNSQSIQSYDSLNPENQNCVAKEIPHSKENTEKNYNIKSNINKKETEEAFKTANAQGKILKKETNSEKCIIQETLPPDKLKHDEVEDKTSKPKQFSNNVDKTDYKILKYKVDQVKRDLFSDDENDHRTLIVNATDNKKVADAENLNKASSKTENVNVENSKQELSTVLQCLQLVPASKKKHLSNDINQADEQIKKQRKPINEDDNKSHQTSDAHNYKAEYHFVYDDSVPMRKRRRRYSAHELQIEINYADLSDPNPVECMKVMKATEFEEIFNLAPKKRTVNKKSRMKNEKVCEAPNLQADKDMINLKDNAAKPLATSSPLDELSKVKTKKVVAKTATINKISNSIQSDAKKKQKLDKHQEKDITKNRKRKLSEAKEMKQAEKKSTTDPQALLSNLDEVDLNKFLTTVHGPE